MGRGGGEWGGEGGRRVCRGEGCTQEKGERKVCMGEGRKEKMKGLGSGRIGGH